MKNIRVFFPRFGGHALYDWDGPNVTNASGFRALMNWVEKGEAPESLDTLKYDFVEDKMIERSSVKVFHLENIE